MASCLQCLCSGLAWKASAQVLLPACIDAWFNGTRIFSAPISSTVSHGLEENERAWFLLATYLSRLTYEAVSHLMAFAKDIDSLEAAIACLLLTLPECIELSSGWIFFD
jgi:hypothetical protein